MSKGKGWTGRHDAAGTLTLADRIRRALRWHLIGYVHTHDEGEPSDRCQGCDEHRTEVDRRHTAR